MKNITKIMKNILYRLIPKRLRNHLLDIFSLSEKSDLPKKELLKIKILIFKNLYNSITKNQNGKLNLNEKEVKVYSQYGEDGILLYIFSQIGVKNGTFVEFGIGDGRVCNTANLSINFGWRGLLMDCDPQNIELARSFYRKRLKDRASDISIVKCKVTMENINKSLLQNGIEGEIDLLSIDIDGNDYWIWKAINLITPRVVIIEYNATFGPKKAITIPYDPNFDTSIRFNTHKSGFYHGASLKALTNLANSKGYRLVACESSGVDAFYIRNDIAPDKIPEISVQEAYYPHSIRSKRSKLTTSEQFALIDDLNYVSV